MQTIIIVCARIPAMTPHQVRYELSVPEVNAILHSDALLQGRKMVFPERLERQRTEMRQSLQQARAHAFKIDIDELLLTDDDALHG